MSQAVVDDIVAGCCRCWSRWKPWASSRATSIRRFRPRDGTAGKPDDALRALGRGSSNGPRLSLTSNAARNSKRRGARCVRSLAHRGKRPWRFRQPVSALRYPPRAQEALYALSARLPPVTSSSLLHCTATPISRAAGGAANENTGAFHNQNEPGSRGGFSLYVPEYYTPDRAWPLVMALHGGSGNGRGFLWSWLRDARSRGAILVAPTATGRHLGADGRRYRTPNRCASWNPFACDGNRRGSGCC